MCLFAVSVPLRGQRASLASVPLLGQGASQWLACCISFGQRASHRPVRLSVAACLAAVASAPLRDQRVSVGQCASQWQRVDPRRPACLFSVVASVPLRGLRASLSSVPLLGQGASQWLACRLFIGKIQRQRWGPSVESLPLCGQRASSRPGWCRSVAACLSVVSGPPFGQCTSSWLACLFGQRASQ